jgi:hypothetical protein
LAATGTATGELQHATEQQENLYYWKGVIHGYFESDGMGDFTNSMYWGDVFMLTSQTDKTTNGLYMVLPSEAAMGVRPCSRPTPLLAPLLQSASACAASSGPPSEAPLLQSASAASSGPPSEAPLLQSASAASSGPPSEAPLLHDTKRKIKREAGNARKKRRRGDSHGPYRT